MIKKNLIIIIVIVLVLGAIMIFINKKEHKNDYSKDVDEIPTQYDEETGLYYIIDEETGEIIYASTTEADLDFYKENPDYNPNSYTIRSTNLQDFIDTEMSESQLIEDAESLEIIGE